MLRWVCAAVFAVLSPGLAVPALAADSRCGEALGDGVRRVSTEGLTLAWRPSMQPMPLDRHLSLDIAVCGVAATGVKVDADMPAHRHGMNYRAMTQMVGEGRFRAEGLLFHMPGRWRLIFDLEQGGQRRRLTDEIELR